MKIKMLLIITLIMSLLMSYSLERTPITQDPWPVPEKYEKMKNPVAADKESLAFAKSLYTKHCKSCHGKEGLGDGPKAEQLDTPSGDFTSEEFQGQSDGSLFYKTVEGRDDMPGFTKKIPEAEDIWALVNYMRTLE